MSRQQKKAITCTFSTISLWLSWPVTTPCSNPAALSDNLLDNLSGFVEMQNSNPAFAVRFSWECRCGAWATARTEVQAEQAVVAHKAQRKKGSAANRQIKKPLGLSPRLDLCLILATRIGLEPTISALTGQYVKPTTPPGHVSRIERKLFAASSVKFP